MTFIAQPLDLDDIFRNLTYESLKVGEDAIVVAIYDGEGRECLSTREHAQRFRNNMFMGTPTVHHHCTSVIRSFSVKVEKYDVPELGALRKFPLQLKIACIFAVTFIMLFTIILPVIRWRIARRDLKAVQTKNRKAARRKQGATRQKKKKSRRSRVARKGKKKRRSLESIGYRSESSGEIVSDDYKYSDEDSSDFEESSFESLSSLEGQHLEIPIAFITNSERPYNHCDD